MDLRGKFSAKLGKCQGSAIDDVADGTVDTFDEALGHSVVKVVEELVPSVAQSVGKPNQVATSRDSDLPYPSQQKSLGLGSVGDFVAGGAELLLPHCRHDRWLVLKGQTIVVYFNVYNAGVANLRTAVYLDDVSIQVCGSTIQVYLPLLLKRR